MISSHSITLALMAGCYTEFSIVLYLVCARLGHGFSLDTPVFVRGLVVLTIPLLFAWGFILGLARKLTR